MTLLYFAWLRSKIGEGAEEFALPPGIGTVRELIAHLRGLGPGDAEALSDLSVVRVAVNQEFADLDQAVTDQDEVALFPPITGGQGGAR
jgi:molybdopterin converting factor subunit 1